MERRMDHPPHLVNLLMVVMNNFLAPHLFNRGIRIHPIFVLFAILGGLQLFGPTGFLIGPLVVGLLFVLIRVVELADEPDEKHS